MKIKDSDIEIVEVYTTRQLNMLWHSLLVHSHVSYRRTFWPKTVCFCDILRNVKIYLFFQKWRPKFKMLILCLHIRLYDMWLHSENELHSLFSFRDNHSLTIFSHMQYWCDLVKQQQLKEWRTHCSMSHHYNKGTVSCQYMCSILPSVPPAPPHRQPSGIVSVYEILLREAV